MVSTVWVNANHGRGLHPFADHMTKLQNFTKEENRDFSVILFSIQSMLEQALTNLIVCMMISQKSIYINCTNELTCCGGY